MSVISEPDFTKEKALNYLPKMRIEEQTKKVAVTMPLSAARPTIYKLFIHKDAFYRIVQEILLTRAVLFIIFGAVYHLACPKSCNPLRFEIN